MLKFFDKLIHVPSEREKQHLNPVDSKKIIIQTILLPIVLMVVLAFLFLSQVDYIRNENGKIRKSDEMLAVSTLALKTIVDADTGLRGFLLTGKEEYLHPWYESKKQAPQLMTKLFVMNQDNKGQLELLTHIQEQFQKWFNDAQAGILLKRNSPETLNTSKYDLRKDLMDDIRISFDQFQQTESTYRKERWEKAEQATKLIVILLIVLGFILGLCMAVFSLLQLKRLSQNYSKAFKSISEATDTLEETVDVRTRELQTVNKELESFCYSVSHDLRAPLRGIDGFSQILSEEYANKLDGEALRYLGFIRQGVQKMGILIDDLIKLSRLTRSEFKKEEVDISIMADELIKELTVPNPERKVQFKNFESETIQADAGLMRVALQNLINNAWKFTGTRELSVIECGKMLKDGQEAYFIRDNGVGFDMRFYDKLFQPFQRLHPKEKFEGTGMGLATVARIIRRHGGNIWAESVVGEGTTFYFTLDVK